VLLPPVGQLSADGQLRELIAERRGRQHGTGPIWYLQPDQVAGSAWARAGARRPWSPPVRPCSRGGLALAADRV